MLLSKEQQKFITKILQQVAVDIKTEQRLHKDSWDKVSSGKKGDMLLRGMNMGKQAAFEKSFQIAKTAAEDSYEAEYNGADQKLKDMAEKISAQAKALSQLADALEQPGRDLILDQAALLENFSRDIKLILRQIEK